MPRVNVPLQSVPNQSAAAVSFISGDAANDHDVSNDGSMFLIVTNSDAAPHSVTVPAVPDEHGRSVDLVRAVAAGTTEVMGPFLPSIWNQSIGLLHVDIDVDTGMSLAAIVLG